MLPDKEPDREEKAIRFGCGALAGTLIGGVFAYSVGGPVILCLATAAVLCALLAMRYGDAFWRVLIMVLCGW